MILKIKKSIEYNFHITETHIERSSMRMHMHTDDNYDDRRKGITVTQHPMRFSFLYQFLFLLFLLIFHNLYLYACARIILMKTHMQPCSRAANILISSVLAVSNVHRAHPPHTHMNKKRNCKLFGAKRTSRLKVDLIECIFLYAAHLKCKMW